MKIVYRIVAAIAALLAFPALFFMKLFHITVELGFVEGFFDDSFSLEDIYNLIADKEINLSEGFQLSENITETLAPLKASAIACAVFLVLMLVMILAVFFCSAFSNSRICNVIFGIIGAISVIGLMTSFSNMTGHIIDGTVGLDKIINSLFADSQSVLGSIAALFGAGSLVSVIGEIKVFQLTAATMAVLFIFIFVVLWSGAFMLIEMDEYKMSKEKSKPKKKHK